MRRNRSTGRYRPNRTVARIIQPKDDALPIKRLVRSLAQFHDSFEGARHRMPSNRHPAGCSPSAAICDYRPATVQNWQPRSADSVPGTLSQLHFAGSWVLRSAREKKKCSCRRRRDQCVFRTPKRQRLTCRPAPHLPGSHRRQPLWRPQLRLDLPDCRQHGCLKKKILHRGEQA